MNSMSRRRVSGDVIHLKPLHFIDIMAAYGAGQAVYTASKIGNALHTIAPRILADPAQTLEIKLIIDDVCSPCRYNRGGFCHNTLDTGRYPNLPASMGYWDLVLDHRWCSHLGIQEGERMTARRLAARIRNRGSDIRHVYREFPEDYRDRKQRNLRAGIRRYLAR
jgi:hypothetical protein